MVTTHRCVSTAFAAMLVFGFGFPPSASAQDLGGWLEPEGGWDYVYHAFEEEDRDGEFLLDGEDSLDGTWTHNNGSDAWDGSGPGDEFRPDEVTDAAPGGAGIVIYEGLGEDGGDAEVLSIVDTGDPRSRGFSDPSNRKVHLCHETLIHEGVDTDGAMQSGITLIVRSRLHPDVDPDTPGWQLPDGGVDDDAGQGAAPGYALRDGGKGGHGFRDGGVGRIFSFSPFGTEGYQFPPEIPAGTTPDNFVNVGDNSVFHSFWVTISDDDENNRYEITVYVDGSIDPAAVYENVNLGTGSDCNGSYLHMGFHSTPQVGGLEVDYIGYREGLHVPNSVCPGGFGAAFDSESGNVELSWSQGAVDSYTVLRDDTPIAEGLPAGTTTFTDTSPARPNATYQLVAIEDGTAKAGCPRPRVTVSTVVCPTLACSTDRAAGSVTLDWTLPQFVTPTGFRILRDGAEVGNVAGDVLTFTDNPDPGEYTYEIETLAEGGAACETNAFCIARLFGAGTVEVIGDDWDTTSASGASEIVTTSDGVKGAWFPAAPKTESDSVSFAVNVADLGSGEIEEGRFRVEVRARYDNPVRIVNRTNESFLEFNLARTGVSSANDDRGEAEDGLEQVPNPPADPTLDSAASTIVNSDNTGLALEEGLNLIEIVAPHDDPMQIFELRIGLFSNLDATIAANPCPAGLVCERQPDGSMLLTWNAGEPHAYEIVRDGDTIAEIPMGDQTSFTDTDVDRGFFTYTLRATDDADCPAIECTGGGGVPNPDGFITEWLIFGPLNWGCVTGGFEQCNAPGEDRISEDHLAGTVGGEAVDEVTIEPIAGMEIQLESSMVLATARADINPNGPGAGQWFPYKAANSTIDYNVVFGGSPGDDHMVYAVTYINNNLGDVELDLGVSSDDSVQVLINEDVVWTNNVARGFGGDGEVQDFVPNVSLQEGLNRVMVKVFQGNGGVGFRLRFEEAGVPITEDLEIDLTPGGPPTDEIRRGDTNTDGSVNIADMIFMLNGLFGDGGPPSCLETADLNGDASYNIADAIFGLNRLFGDGPPPVGGAGPEGTDCGADPSPANSLGCDSYDKC